MRAADQSKLLGEHHPAYTDAREKTNAMLSHGLPLIFFIVPFPFGNFLSALIFWNVAKGASPAAAAEGKEAVNFQLAVGLILFAIAAFAAILLAYVSRPLGFLVLIAGGFVSIYFIALAIIAARKGSEGHSFKYPFTLRLVK